MEDVSLWVAQALLAVMFLLVGFGHVFRFDSFVARPRMGWGNDVGRTNMRVIGLLEMAGAIGVIVPAATGILAWLTHLAAAGLALLMLVAAVFHLRRDEPVIGNLIFFAVAMVVVVGRIFVAPI